MEVFLSLMIGKIFRKYILGIFSRRFPENIYFKENSPKREKLSNSVFINLKVLRRKKIRISILHFFLYLSITQCFSHPSSQGNHRVYLWTIKSTFCELCTRAHIVAQARFATTPCREKLISDLFSVLPIDSVVFSTVPSQLLR